MRVFLYKERVFGLFWGIVLLREGKGGFLGYNDKKTRHLSKKE